ncbi:oxidoreductase [Bacillus sp. HNG]|uniref:flavin-containing monooxygenase n=1 Tax=Bacillus sp. HNG TaxID=2293325 RepID=UPI000E2F31C4|nr:NAD(P)/FAD-dependent oxidoreductase [Bacillus sp. HNG]RFB13544.1 oxidoreductase [Bacillus sp. HNG]
MYDVVVIGAGQAGLAMGFYLKKTNQSFLLLDKAKEIGEVWRNRYDSLTLFTPRTYSELPYFQMQGPRHGYPTKDEVADYLTQYASHHSLPIQLDTTITKVTRADTGFVIETTNSVIHTKNVVVATGPFQEPLLPSFAASIPDTVFQVHSSQYKNPYQLQNGPVLVVGGGNSGAQIAVELAKERDVYLSVSQKLTFIPQDLAGRSIFWWFDKFGILKANVTSKLGQIIKNRPDPIFGFELRKAIQSQKIIMKPRTTDVKEDTFVFQDNSDLKVANVVWATGFSANYQWLQIPEALKQNGQPLHKRGITNIEGLYFLGLPWQSRRGSALLQGVADDAEYIVQHIRDAKHI